MGGAILGGADLLRAVERRASKRVSALLRLGAPARAVLHRKEWFGTSVRVVVGGKGYALGKHNFDCVWRACVELGWGVTVVGEGGEIESSLEPLHADN